MKKICILFILVGLTVSFSKGNKKILKREASEVFAVSNYQRLFNQNEYRLPQNRIKIESSSFLKDKKYSYPPNNVIDGNINTSWAEGVSGFGKGEWIKFTLDLRNMKGSTYQMIILPGYGKNEQLFKKNNRLKTFMLKSPDFNFDDRYELKDKYALHSLLFTKLYSGKIYTITLYIEDVYKGSKYDDTCIGEIIVIMMKPPVFIDR